VTLTSEPVGAPATEGPTATRPRRDLQQTFRLLLATVWLLDAALQLQQFFFTPGKSGFSGMLGGLASGNPGWVAHTITWNASVVQHQPVLTNSLFAAIQFLIAFGIAWRPTCRPALVLSMVWSVGVWWFGEGLGNTLIGRATPFGGGPGAVLFYALLALLLWPSSGSNAPFVAARTIGTEAAKIVWACVWLALAVLTVVGSGRSPQALHDLVAGTSSGGPGWLVRIDHWSESIFLRHGTAVAIVFALFCVLVAASVYLPTSTRQVILVLASAAFVVIWVAAENVGGILAGGATDPNSGPLVVLLILVYWPLTDTTWFAAPAARRLESLAPAEA